LHQNEIDKDLIYKRLLELNEEEQKIKNERINLNFKRQQLALEPKSIKNLKVIWKTKYISSYLRTT